MAGIRVRRGLESARAAYTPAAGEPLWTTDDGLLFLGDGSTAGGNLVGPFPSIERVDTVGGANLATRQAIDFDSDGDSDDRGWLSWSGSPDFWVECAKGGIVEVLAQVSVENTDTIGSFMADLREFDSDAMSWRDLSKSVRYGFSHQAHGDNSLVIAVQRLVSAGWRFQVRASRNSGTSSAMVTIAGSSTLRVRYLRHP